MYERYVVALSLLLSSCASGSVQQSTEKKLESCLKNQQTEEELYDATIQAGADAYNLQTRILNNLAKTLTPDELEKIKKSISDAYDNDQWKQPWLYLPSENANINEKLQICETNVELISGALDHSLKRVLDTNSENDNLLKKIPKQDQKTIQF